MSDLFRTGIGRLRLIALLEGSSLLLLLFVAVPLKSVYDDPSLVTALGPVHGAFVLLYLINCFGAAVEYNWQFRRTTGRLVLACMIPFGTFYMDRKIFLPLYRLRKKKH